ncbi:MAG: RNA 3'-phosphate cyclase, partial [Pararheinheimera sp.]|nr:RNA 3'-phosphate cyclase [Rheinheimera sp.]
MKNKLIIDGSMGEGGGQVLRSSLTLAMLLQQPFEIQNIRAGREKPGLLRQHLTCVRAAATICNAKVTGDVLGSDRVSFEPGPVTPGDYHFVIGSAGSTTLVCQTLLLPLAMAGAQSRIRF